MLQVDEILRQYALNVAEAEQSTRGFFSVDNATFGKRVLEAESFAKDQLKSLLLSEAETFVRDKEYNVVKTENGKVEKMMGQEYVQAIPIEAINRLFGDKE